MSYWVYLIAAVCCLVGELFTMEFSATCIGIGFLGAAGMSALGFGLTTQVLVFIGLAVICWVGIRPVALRHFYKNTKDVTTPTQDVIGKECVVESDIVPLKNQGRVLVKGESWKATAAQEIKKGTACVVREVKGVTLLVEIKK